MDTNVGVMIALSARVCDARPARLAIGMRDWAPWFMINAPARIRSRPIVRVVFRIYYA